MNALPSSSEITREGCPLHFWLTGPAERPLVVFTHGAGIDHREWEDTLPIVAQDYRVLCWDVRGHGQSHPTGSPFTLARATDDLLALLDAVGANRTILVGHSMGGNISQEVIFRTPERVQAAVLLGCTRNTQKLSPLERGIAPLVDFLLKLYPYDLLRRQSADLYSDHPEVRAYLYEAFGLMNKAEFKALLPQLLKDLHEEPGYQIPVPFLLLHGEHDASGNIRTLAPTWARTEPHCEYAVIPRAGHVANMDNPQVFNQLLLDFLHRQWPLSPTA
jgi:3-oxoadipate enol-lactonase